MSNEFDRKKPEGHRPQGEKRNAPPRDGRRFDRPGEGKPRHERTEGGKPRFDRAEGGRPGEAKPRFDRPGSGRPGDRRPGGAKKPAPRKTARDAALKALQDVARGDAYASQALDQQLDGAQLSPEDRRLAAGIFYFAVENRLYLEHVLAQFAETKPEPVVTDILHIAAAQLLFMDRIPDHAAVDEAVKQVRSYHREGLAGMVNGVLRSLIRARDAGEIALPDREAEPEKWLSVKTSTALPVVERLISAYGFEEAERIAAHVPSKREQTVRPNLTRMDGEAFAGWLDQRQFHWRRGLAENAFIIEDGGNLAALDGYRRGDFSIQGESAMLAAQAVQARPGMQILDACAAPGGKTCLMAERMGGSGRVYAWDVHEHRVQLIYAAARRLGLDNVRPSLRDARNLPESMALAMDAVLVDAPCSGLGVIADKPDIRYRQNEATLDALPPLQAAILESCARAVKVGGLLVYATCTVLPAENGDIARAFLEKHPEFAPDEDDGWLPEALRPRLEKGMIQLLPHRDGVEGFFIARMRRKGV